MEKKKVILFVTSSSINGGAQKHIREMFVSLTKEGHEVYLAAPEGWLLDELTAYCNHLYPLTSMRKSRKELEALIEKIKPDVTNTFILSGGVAGTLAWKKKKYGKLFVTVNNPVIYDGVSFAGRILFPLFYKWMSKYANAFLVKSDTVKDEVETVIRDRKPVLSIKNGIDFKIFDKEATYPDLHQILGIEKDDIVVTNVAVLEQRKGQEHLIEAVSELRKNYPIHLFLAGEGSNRQNLERQIKELDAEEYVHLLGRRSDVNCVLSNSDIFVLSSYHEGLPNSLMEAMAMGLPCVATDVGGVRQLISDKEEGVVVHPKSTEEIVMAINYLLGNKDFAKRMGHSAYEKMRDCYSQETAVQELEAIYEKY